VLTFIGRLPRVPPKSIPPHPRGAVPRLKAPYLRWISIAMDGGESPMARVTAPRPPPRPLHLRTWAPERPVACALAQGATRDVHPLPPRRALGAQAVLSPPHAPPPGLEGEPRGVPPRPPGGASQAPLPPLDLSLPLFPSIALSCALRPPMLPPPPFPHLPLTPPPRHVGRPLRPGARR